MSCQSYKFSQRTASLTVVTDDPDSATKPVIFPVTNGLILPKEELATRKVRLGPARGQVDFPDMAPGTTNYLEPDQCRGVSAKENKGTKLCDKGGFALLGKYGEGSCDKETRPCAKDFQTYLKYANEVTEIMKLDTWMAPSALFEAPADNDCLSNEHHLQVIRCTEFTKTDSEEHNYITIEKQRTEFMVSPADYEE
ncbi:hypothetical protein D915_003845 [Fasciola hepatica]|uniref:Uncharacterized protein n=1 Tax=Fasciola hepatica TaxID=6192 RepID=A0A4E0RHE8_FASHE|nr:hypothetical protein D915_003845 [Fasciola hepatica]